MKKIKDTLYGFAVIMVAVTNLTYLVSVTYSGVANVDDYSIEGVGLFVYVILTSFILIRYPVKIWATNVVNFLKADMKKQKNKIRDKKQVKTA